EEIDKSSKTRREAALWLAPSNTSTDLDNLREQRDSGSCYWLLEKSKYQQWLKSARSSVLWIYGIPGSGKSVLASFVIDDIYRRLPSSVAVVYYFCNGRSTSKSASITILRSVLHQLQVLLPSASGIVEEACRESPYSVAQFDELWEVFRKLVRAASVVYCVVDGLDECS
ncbi:hypothetical protein B0O99DRAFT_495377, partial [Bisporella sp. PMI_857]